MPSKEIIYTKNAPEPIGPYSQAVRFENTIYVSGQIGIHPTSGNLGSTLEEETHQVLKNIEAILAASNSSMDKVIKCSIFLANMDDFTKVNEIYAEYFTLSAPARETVAVRTLPKNVQIEISCIAHV